MLIENLSDYAGDALRDSRDQHRQARDDLDLARTQRREAEESYASARHSKPLWKRLLFVPSPEEREARQRLGEAQRRVQQAQQRRLQMDQRVKQQAAGVQGEDDLVAALASALSDDWALFAGYKNRRAEADAVVVGPPGVWVIEVKNRNARLHVDGDRWWYQKLDRWGNVVETGSATDNKNRTWGRQAADVAHDLAWWLDRNQQPVSIRTAVMLMHGRASVGTVQNPDVDLISTNPRELLQAMTDAEPMLSPGARAAIGKLIRRDHEYHNQHRERRN